MAPCSTYSPKNGLRRCVRYGCARAERFCTNCSAGSDCTNSPGATAPELRRASEHGNDNPAETLAPSPSVPDEPVPVIWTNIWSTVVRRNMLVYDVHSCAVGRSLR
eukprot:Selendium_serpulae@DN6846_c0_g1_i1.p2